MALDKKLATKPVKKPKKQTKGDKNASQKS